MDFNLIPDEILEKILLLCPGDTIPELTLVSTRFNEVISGSVKLMENFTLTWEKNKDLDKRPLLESKRKYRNMQVIETIGVRSSLDRFFHQHGSTLTTLYFNDCAFSSTELKSILVLVAQNLTEFNLCEVNFEIDCEVKSITLPKLERMEVMYGRGDGFASIFPFFIGANVKRLLYEDQFEMMPHDVTNFLSFLQSQSQLSDLSLTSNIVSKLFHDDSFATQDHLFRLQKVFMWINERDGFTADDEVYQNIAKFLDRQKASLRDLTMARCVLPNSTFNALLELPLKRLNLVKTTIEGRSTLTTPNETIEKMFISMLDVLDQNTEFNLCQLFKRCSNLRSLRFSCVEITFELSLTMAYNMEKLESMYYYSCELFPFTYPRLRMLEFVNCIDEEVMRLLLVNRGLEKIIVPSILRSDTSFQHVVRESLVKMVVYD